MAKLRQKMEQQLIEKAMKDESFRKQLVEDPKSTFELEMGVILPESLKVKVLQEDQHNLYLVLPKMQSEAGESELTEAELSSVAGGQETIWTGADTCTKNLPPE
jgi:hypothetical protein